MLSVYDPQAQPDAALVPIGAADLPTVVAADAPVVWIDAADPTRAELEALAAAFSWPAHVVDMLDEHEARQRFLPMGDWSLIAAVSPTGDGVGMIAVRQRHAVTLRWAWDVDLSGSAREVLQWPDPHAGGMIAVCVLLGHLVENYEDASGDLEDRLVDQEATALEPPKGGDPLPSLRETAALRGAVGDLRRRSNRLREVLGAVIRQELVDRTHGEAVDLDLRDIYDHLLRVHDDLDAYSDRLIALQDARLSLVSYKQNDIVRKISGWGAVLLIPTITTSWYGQNFAHLWLLDSPWGPVVNVAVTLVAMGGAVALLRRADWL